MSCSYYTFRQNDYYCTKKGDYVNSDTYYRYCKGYYYDECPIYRHEESSGCYLTTIVCNALRAQDNSSTLNTLRKFRDEVLQKDSKYDAILEQYDTVGPKIARCINSDNDREYIASLAYFNCLLPICRCIKAKKIEEAVAGYEEMTSIFIEYYGLKEQYDDVVSLEGRNKGHGRCMKKNN